MDFLSHQILVSSFFIHFFRLFHILHFITLNYFKSKPEKQKYKKVVPKDEKKETEKKPNPESSEKKDEPKEEENSFYKEYDSFMEEMDRDDPVEKKPWINQTWELSLWNYQEIPMLFFCFFNPVHVILIKFSYGARYDDPRNYSLVLIAFLYSFTVRLINIHIRYIS